MFRKTIISIIFIIGLVSLSVSIYPIFLFAREWYIENQIHSRYELKPLINIWNYSDQPNNVLKSPLIIEGNKIEVLTEDTGILAPKTWFNSEKNEHIMNIRIMINDIEIGSLQEAWFSPSREEDSRFLSWLNIVEVLDKDNMTKEIAIVQRMKKELEINGIGITATQAWRILHVKDNKKIFEENFSYIDRGEHPLGVRLVQISNQSSSMIGFKSDITKYWPSLIFPILYPFLSFLFGVIVLIIILVLFIKRIKVNR